MIALRWCVPVIGLALVSCAPREAGVTLDTEKVSAEEVTRLVAERAGRIRTFTGRGTLIVDAPEYSGTARFDLAVRRPDSALIRIEGPFGIDIATVVIGRTKYLAYNSMNNTVTTGSLEGRDLETVFPIAVPMDRLIEAVSGSITLPGAAPTRYAVDEECFLLTFRERRGTASYWVDPAELMVTRLTLTDSTGVTVLDVRSSRLVAFDGFSLPRRIDLQIPAKDSQIAISFSSQKPNDPAPSFVYSIPRNARRRER